MKITASREHPSLSVLFHRFEIYTKDKVSLEIFKFYSDVIFTVRSNNNIYINIIYYQKNLLRITLLSGKDYE